MRALLAAFLVAGIALRLAAALAHPPLGLDEARLALNVAARSFGELLQPLDHDQSAPPLYLWLQHGAVLLVGVHDWALRLVPLVFGLTLLARTPATLQRLLPSRAVVLATALVACSPLLVHYAISVKQYGVEAALTLLGLGLSLSCREARYRHGPAARMVVFGVVLPWLATPAPFVLAGVTGCTLGDATRGDRDARRFVLWSLPLWAVSLALAYVIAYGPASGNPYLRHYWDSALLVPTGEHYAERLWALLNENLWGLALGYPGPPGRHLSNLTFLGIAVVVLLLLAVGARWLLKRHGWSIVLLVTTPLVAAIGASLLGVYPVSLRLMLFAAPLVQLLVVSGLQALTERLDDPSARRGWVLAGSTLTLPLLAISLLQVGRDPPEDVRALTHELARLRRREPTYVFAGSVPPWLFYSTDWKAPDVRRLQVVARLAGAGGAAFENAPSRGRVDPAKAVGLTYRSAAGPELYGLATGIEWTPSLGPLKRSTDTGWTDAEADRVASVDGGAVWVLMSHMVGNEVELLRELGRRGACATYVRQLDNAVLVRYALTPHKPGVRLPCRELADRRHMAPLLRSHTPPS
jgi:hypothetical protein